MVIRRPIACSRPRSLSLGRIEEAREAARQGLDLSPSFTIARYRSSGFSRNPVYIAGRERMYEGMRLAGIPEG